MAWEKATQKLVEAFDAALPDDARVERRLMFGCPCAFTGGNMFAGLHEQNLFVRLPEEERESLLRQRGARRFEPMPGRVMREYVVVPAGMIRNRTALDAAMRGAFSYAASLPAKKRLRAKSMPAARENAPKAARRRTRR